MHFYHKQWYTKLMILALHITIALLSILFTSITAFKPSKYRLNISYILAGGTLGSGVLLVVVEPKTMVQACISGLVYFAIVSFIIALTQKKLASQKVSIE